MSRTTSRSPELNPHAQFVWTVTNRRPESQWSGNLKHSWTVKHRSPPPPPPSFRHCSPTFTPWISLHPCHWPRGTDSPTAALTSTPPPPPSPPLRPSPPHSTILLLFRCQTWSCPVETHKKRSEVRSSSVKRRFLFRSMCPTETLQRASPCATVPLDWA